ncbi:hypothetical protein [Intrasporangium flavum]|uniref:hypothetical protein n=1 Tax=Intrasporangium flavum TaxID=1428657 RepID=UPI00096CC629|nr:hypothetical protein [Intrasporangium flavum]
MTLDRERVPAASAALLAIALAVPSLLAATWHLTTVASDSGAAVLEQREWSWGRSQSLGAGGAVVQDLWNPWGLAVLVALLGLTLVAVLAHLLSDAPWARVVAPASAALLLGRLVTTVSERLGRPVRDDVHGLSAQGASTLAGTAETAAAAVLVVALVLMVAALAGVRASALGEVVRRPVGSVPDASGSAAAEVVADPAGSVAAGTGSARADDGADLSGAVVADAEAPPPDAPRRLPRLVPGRALVAALGAAGALLAVPQLFWPTHSVGVRGEGPTGGYDFRQSIWSWGRYADTTTVDAGQFDLSNPFTLTLFAASIVVGLAACAAYALRAGVDGRVLGAAGLGWALLGLGAPLAQRVGDTVTGLYGDNPLMEVETHLTGWLQWVSVASLLAAFGLVVARPAASTLRVAWPGLVAWVVRLRDSREVDDAPADVFGDAFGDASGAAGSDASGHRPGSVPGAPAPRIGVATLRDLPAGDRSGSGARVVGFSDDGDDGDDGGHADHPGGLGRRRHPDAS